MTAADVQYLELLARAVAHALLAELRSTADRHPPQRPPVEAGP